MKLAFEIDAQAEEDPRVGLRNHQLSGHESKGALLLVLWCFIAGTELFQSYCPLSWDYEERQAHCKEVYGFQCTCQRCQMEAQYGRADMQRDEGASSGGWMTDDEAADAGEADKMGDDDVPSTSGDQQGGGMAVDEGMEEEKSGPLDPTYLQLFLLKYVCPVPSCFGTMAPVSPGASMHECAVCGHCRSEEQFMSDLEGPMAE